MITWQQKLAYVGLEWKRFPKRYNGRVHVQVRYPSGLSSFGIGDDLEAALCSAAQCMPIDWHSVARKMTETEWRKIAHE